MIKKSICIVIFAICCAYHASAEIKKICSFSEAKEVIEKANVNTLVIFDIDNTVCVKEWPFLQDRYSSDPLVMNFWEEPHSCCNITADELEKIIFEAPEMLIEPIIVKIIKNLQEKNIPVIALTSRATGDWAGIKNLEEKLYLILKTFDIDFSSSFPIKEPFFSEKDLLFYKGIGFVPRNENKEEKTDKGDVLMKLLEKANFIPERIIFFDDNFVNIKKVNEAIMLYNKNSKNNIQINYFGFLYNGESMLPDCFNENIIKIQLENLLSSGFLLGEKEAQELFEEKEKKDEKLLFYDNDDSSDDSDSSYNSEKIETRIKNLSL